jgi:hypothetical protein
LERLGAKHASFGEAWKKAWRVPLFRHRWLLPPAASDRAGSSLRGAKLRGAKLRSNPGVGKRRSNAAVSSRERRPECMEKRMARFIQGDRPEAGAELAMTDRELARLFLRVALACERPVGDRFAAGRGRPRARFPQDGGVDFFASPFFRKNKIRGSVLFSLPGASSGGRGMSSRQAGQEFGNLRLAVLIPCIRLKLHDILRESGKQLSTYVPAPSPWRPPSRSWFF